MNACVSLFEKLVGPSGLEPPTSCLSGTRSNLLSYEPMWLVSDLGHLNSVVTFTKWRFHFGLPKFHSLCEFHFDEVKISLRNYVSLVEMMGSIRAANYAAWSPSALTVHRTVIHFRLCSNPFSLWDASPIGFGTFVPWWRWWDSNPWPPACRAGALPAELHPRLR